MRQERLPELEENQPRVEPVHQPAPLDINVRVNNEGHKHIVKVVLPILKDVMLRPESCTLPPREQIKLALLEVDQKGLRFWGQYDMYTRKRTVEDIVLQHYYDVVRGTL